MPLSLNDKMDFPRVFGVAGVAEGAGQRGEGEREREETYVDFMFGPISYMRSFTPKAKHV